MPESSTVGSFAAVDMERSGVAIEGQVRDLEPLRGAIERQLGPTGRVLLRGSGGDGASARYVIGLGGEHTDDVIRQIALRSGHRAWLVDVLVDATVSAAHWQYVHGSWRACTNQALEELRAAVAAG